MTATVTERHRELARQAVNNPGGWIQVIAQAIANAEECGREAGLREASELVSDYHARHTDMCDCKPGPMLRRLARNILALLPEVKP